MSIIGNIIKGILALAMIAAVVVIAAFIFTSSDFHINIGSGGSATTSTSAALSNGPVTFTIKPGETVSTISDHLQQAGIISSPTIFRLRLKLRGAEGSLKAGDFQLTPGMDVDKLIDTLSTSPRELGWKFTVIEGERIGEMAENLASAGLVDTDTFKQLAGTPDGSSAYVDDFIQNSGKPADQGLEGFLFPDTYEIKKQSGDNSDAIIKIMLGNLEAKFTPEMRQKVADRKLTIYQVLTIASLVQREGQVKSDLPLIASVFWNRIDRNMSLDSDPTTQYALGKPGKWWPNLDQIGVLPKDVNDPYNTYVIPGLPPGPICNPGFNSIEAAVNPAQTDYLYFVAKGDGSGEHAFAKTLDEQTQNQHKYQP